MQPSAQSTESATRPAARFHANRLKWIYAARADFFEPRTYLQDVLIEPCTEGGVYLVATNGALMMIAYDATGSASHRFTFNPLPEIANICGFPFDGEEAMFDTSTWADIITIDGDTLTAGAALPNNAEPAPLLMQKIKAGKEFPNWQLLAKHSGPTNPVRAFIQSSLLEIAIYGLKGTAAEISLHRYSPQGADTEAQPLHITFANLPLRGVLMPLKSKDGEPPAAPMPMPFDA